MDKMLDGKKFRAVFFLKYRQIFSVRPSDITPTLQQRASYLPGRVYVFAYNDLEWNVLDASKRPATLVSSVGLDCCEFDKNGLSSEWETASLSRWLNEDFFVTAFSEAERKLLWQNSHDEYVAIPDKQLDFASKKQIEQFNSYNITGSDYFRCLGGASDRNVGSFWIKEEATESDRATTAQPHNIETPIQQYVDAGTVAVVPVIRIRVRIEE